jgi:hypothetical protein
MSSSVSGFSLLVFPATITRSLPLLLGAAELGLGRSGTRNRQTMLTSQSRETIGRVSANRKRIEFASGFTKHYATFLKK